MYILCTLLGLIIGLTIFYPIFYLFNKYRKPTKKELDKEQQERLEKVKNEFTKLMTYSIEKAVKVVK